MVNFALAALTTFLAGILGVFIAILVTAPTVPQTFEPGAIDLLLSKPVSRSLLFLTKFFGASTFILLNSIYLIGGMWLIAGLRFDIWSGRLLLCIPVFLFLFVIYYSVSALTGRYLAECDRFGLLHDCVLGRLFRGRHGEERGRKYVPRSDTTVGHHSGGRQAFGRQ